MRSNNDDAEWLLAYFERARQEWAEDQRKKQRRKDEAAYKRFMQQVLTPQG
jgi:hypothetical protein